MTFVRTLGYRRDLLVTGNMMALPYARLRGNLIDNALFRVVSSLIRFCQAQNELPSRIGGVLTSSN
jgi:hypothetical protein